MMEFISCKIGSVEWFRLARRDSFAFIFIDDKDGVFVTEGW